MWADMNRAGAGKTRRLLSSTLACAAVCVGIMRHSPGAAEPQKHSVKVQSRDWPIYGGQKANDHYSPLAQINRNNVGRLAVAWTSIPEKRALACRRARSSWGRRFTRNSPTQKVIALDAAEQEAALELRFRRDEHAAGTRPHMVDGQFCRLLAGIANFLYVLNPRDGKYRSASFGEDGRIDLRTFSVGIIVRNRSHSRPQESSTRTSSS